MTKVSVSIGTSSIVSSSSIKILFFDLFRPFSCRFSKTGLPLSSRTENTFVIETDNAEIVDDSDVTIATGFRAKSEDNTSGDEQTFELDFLYLQGLK
jgi:hypothetical protein